MSPRLNGERHDFRFCPNCGARQLHLHSRRVFGTGASASYHQCGRCHMVFDPFAAWGALQGVR